MTRTNQQRVTVEGSWVTVDVHGRPDGPALVIVPGVMSDAAEWRPVVSRLVGWGTLAVVNRRGREPSGPLGDGYSLETELADLTAVLDGFADVRTLFGWSYGGLIALELANRRPVPHVIAYEPVVRPFGGAVLPALRAAAAAGDLDMTVRAVLEQIAGLRPDVVGQMRADASLWDALCAVAGPVHAETVALNGAPLPERLGGCAGRVDLLVGERNRGRAPYGTAFDDVRRLVAGAHVHELPGQGHLAHVEAPADLAAWLDGVGALPRPS